jgi:putative ubiquitin-RnfH superfamily antitoxin RatB of RatAB toxin-antitoxin module
MWGVNIIELLRELVEDPKEIDKIVNKKAIEEDSENENEK